MSRNPAGGPATIGGVIYQMLWCLLRLARVEIRSVVECDSQPGVFSEAVLVLEPRGGGDVQEQRGDELVVTQVKSRSDGGTWSLQEIITGVFPDLLN